MSSSASGSYVVRGVLALGVLCWVLQLSAGARGWVDYTVLTFVGLCIAWNLLRLVQRLHGAGGGRSAWHALRTALFWFLGLGYAVFGRVEYDGTWREAWGWLLLVLAAADTVLLFLRERAVVASVPEP